MSAIDFACPRCDAKPGQPCVSAGGRIGKGAPMKRLHDARYAVAPKSVIECGTYAGFQQHKRKGETICDPCRLARNEWMAQYRRSHPADYAYERRMTNARSRALWRLAKKYPDDFRAYVLEETR